MDWLMRTQLHFVLKSGLGLNPCHHQVLSDSAGRVLALQQLQVKLTGSESGVCLVKMKHEVWWLDEKPRCFWTNTLKDNRSEHQLSGCCSLSAVLFCPRPSVLLLSFMSLSITRNKDRTVSPDNKEQSKSNQLFTVLLPLRCSFMCLLWSCN